MPDPPQGAGFTGATGTFDTSVLGNFASSFQSEFTRTTDGVSATSSSSSDASSSSTAASSSPSSAQSTTFSTSISSSKPANTPSATLANSPSATASDAASNTSGSAVTVEKSTCNSVSCSSGLQAAIAVPVIVAVLAAIFLWFCCARRRRKQAAAGAGTGTLSEKRPSKKVGKKWTRHLRAFSFDAELLMGGRFSSSNSLRSREQAGSVRSGVSRGGASSAEPSMHSIEEVAPPYRDALSHATPPSPARSARAPGAAAAIATAAAGDPITRPLSTATAPPPYRSATGATPEPPTPSTVRNPFSDSPPVSPIDEGPFNDPPGALHHSASRGSSTFRSLMTDDDAATPTASEAGSIRQAVVGRRVSVRDAASSNTGGS